MSGGMYGADVAQLRELARQMQAASDQLDGARRRIGTDIRISAWIGPVAVRFRTQWDNDHSRQVQLASDALARMAEAAIRNADDQERASARDGGPNGGGFGVGPNSVQPIPHPYPLDARFPGFGVGLLPWPAGGPLLPLPDWFEDLGQVWRNNERPSAASWKAFTDRLGVVLGSTSAALTIAGWITTLQDTGLLSTNLMKAPIVEEIAAPLGLALSAIDTADSIREGDVVGAWLNGGSGVVDAGLSTAGTAAKVALGGAAGTAAATGLAVVGLGVGALGGLIDFALPYSAEKQDATFARGVANAFPGADPDNLTPAQQDYMSRRYQGWGVANMISDQMQASGEPIRKGIISTATFVGDSAVDIWKGIDHVLGR